MCISGWFLIIVTPIWWNTASVVLNARAVTKCVIHKGFQKYKIVISNMWREVLFRGIGQRQPLTAYKESLIGKKCDFVDTPNCDFMKSPCGKSHVVIIPFIYFHSVFFCPFLSSILLYSFSISVTSFSASLLLFSLFFCQALLPVREVWLMRRLGASVCNTKKRKNTHMYGCGTLLRLKHRTHTHTEAELFRWVSSTQQSVTKTPKTWAIAHSLHLSTT